MSVFSEVKVPETSCASYFLLKICIHRLYMKIGWTVCCNVGFFSLKTQTQRYSDYLQAELAHKPLQQAI